MAERFNYRHLYYFWVVAKEGGIARAAERLGMAIQTISTQVHELERSLGYALLKQSGRTTQLSDAGRVAMSLADEIFALGERLPAAVKDAATSPTVRLTVGIGDGLPKLVMRRLMQPAIDEPRLRLICHVDEFDRLLGELALHRLDVVLADRPAPPHRHVRLYSHPLGKSTIAWYAPALLESRARKGFPASLARVPVLLPTAHSEMRLRLDQWFESLAISPRIVGEFEDSALLKTFGASGMGVFPAAEFVDRDLKSRYDVKRVGRCDNIEERFFAIGTEKKVQHPLVQKLLQTQHR